MKWKAGALVLAGAVIVGAVALVAFREETGGQGVTTPTAFDLPPLRGTDRVRLSDFRGKPVVVNFYASWCSTCDFELPGFARVSDELRGKVAFVGVNSLETGDPMYMPERHDITWWPLARDVGGRNGSGLHDALGGGTGMPLTAFYDADGQLLRTDRAALPESTLRSTLQELYGV